LRKRATAAETLSRDCASPRTGTPSSGPLRCAPGSKSWPSSISPEPLRKCVTGPNKAVICVPEQITPEPLSPRTTASFHSSPDEFTSTIDSVSLDKRRGHLVGCTMPTFLHQLLRASALSMVYICVPALIAFPAALTVATVSGPRSVNCPDCGAPFRLEAIRESCFRARSACFRSAHDPPTERKEHRAFPRFTARRLFTLDLSSA
jgi:hypothetical protein